MCHSNFPSCVSNTTYLPCESLCKLFQAECAIANDPCDTLKSSYEYLQKCDFSNAFSVTLIYFLV